MTSLVEILIDLPFVVSIILKITIILSIGWIMHFTLAGRNPRWRVLLWRCIIVGIFLIPALVPLKSLQIRIAQPPESPATSGTYSASESNVTFSSREVPLEATFVSGSVRHKNSHESQTSFSLLAWPRIYILWIVFAVWGIVAIILAMRLLVGFIRIKKRIKNSLPGPEHLQQLLDRVASDLDCRRKVTLYHSPELLTPFLAGFRKPVIVLPERMMGDAYDVESPAIIAHEVAHLCSGDLFWMFVVRLTGIFLWFHPLIWKLRDAHNSACEEVCDAVAADFVGNAELYSSTLARVALDVMSNVLTIGGIPMVRSSDIFARLRLLKRKVYSNPLARRWVIPSFLTGMIVFGCLGGIKLAYAEDNQSSSVTEGPFSGFKGIKVDFNKINSNELAKSKVLMYCFWNMEQRPSRNLVRELAKQANEIKKKGIFVILMHTSEIEAQDLNKWIDENKIPFLSGRITGDSKKFLYRWGVRAQPWLVLTDKNVEVRVGGFELEQLDAKLQEISSAEPAEKQVSQVSDTILLKLIDSDGLPVGGAKVGTNIRTRDEMILGTNLSWSLSGHEHNISNEWGEISLSREKLFPSFWAEGRKRGLYVLHEERKIGAIFDISKDDVRNTIELTLVPVCHVHGKLASEALKKVDRPLTWSNVYMYWDKDTHGVLSHMSDEQKFEFFVPPGQYEFSAYGSGGYGGDPPRTSANTKHKTLKIEVKENQPELDLGTIDLPPTKIATLIGKPAPDIGPIKAWKNGSPVKLSDLRGKAVIIYFDGDSPNTSRDLPRFVELHEDFKDHGLVIIALYNSASMEELEKKWVEIYEKYGGEPDVPFRIAVDGGESSFYEGTDKVRLGATYATYDITGDPTTVLIDTQGNVVGGLNLFYAKETIQKLLGVTAEPGLAAWRQQFNKLYFLDDGQILKRIAPPFIPERVDYYQEEESSQYSDINDPPDFFTFRWDGELKRWGMGFGNGKRPLKSVLHNNLSMNQNSYEGPEELLEIDVPGDWIVRKDASEEQKLKALEVILAKEIGRKIQFVKRKVEREAIIATGSFQYHRLPVAKDDRWILMFSGDFIDEQGGGGGTADSVHEFLEAIGNRVNLPVIDQTEPSGEVRIPYRHYRSAYLSRIEDPNEKAEKLIQLLDNISRQTNLQFKVEKRAIEKWFVVEEQGE